MNAEKYSFSCLTCRVVFKDMELQRRHYQCDWHRYNLKRKVAELPPVTTEEFARRVLEQKKINEDQTKSSSVYCNACKKNFGNAKSYDNHLNSKKHLLNEVTVNESNNIQDEPEKNEKIVIDEDCFVDSDIEEVDSDEWDDNTENPIDKNDCLFCSHHSSNFVKNLKHMSIAHSFFVPDVEYCIDIQGLMRYLGEKINKGEF